MGVPHILSANKIRVSGVGLDVFLFGWFCLSFAEEMRSDDVALHVEKLNLKFTADQDCRLRCLP